MFLVFRCCNGIKSNSNAATVINSLFLVVLLFVGLLLFGTSLVVFVSIDGRRRAQQVKSNGILMSFFVSRLLVVVEMWFSFPDDSTGVDGSFRHF